MKPVRISQKTITLSEGTTGYSIAALEGQSELMREHRKALDELKQIPEESARQFMATAGITMPWRKSLSSADDIFGNIRSIARSGPHTGTLYYLSFGKETVDAAESLYVVHVDNSGFRSELLVCRIADGSFLGYNAMGDVGKRLAIS